MTALKIFNKKKKTDRETAKETKTKSSESRVAKVASQTYSGKSVLQKLCQTERATNLSRHNQYVFLVNVSANKPLIKEEIQRRYGVKVLSVNILKQKGKVKKLGGRIGVRSGSKKAFIFLKEGDKIEIA